MTTHLHITSWVLALVLLGLSTWFYRFGKQKQGKITHMVLRLDYLLILYSGGSLLGGYFGGDTSGYMIELIVKVISGLWVIYAMEMILIRSNKQHGTRSGWIQFWIAIVLALVLGFGRLPFGILP
ncbi:DUF1516 family protein [Pontibacillus yanchengensis]|uniref:DUF1516 family protein n=2 Tax=Pontibacillus yanchengensis TaxID=462910 RepID=A0A6I4ZVC6_9BACI|nr:YisL family protein [Pontibacillus yanchengensis]MYL32287.1 DUF1516 family protein [Pontibacillus yanchengensis]MYL52867.1 DUF1516 family protein [Pontibacillus yanchengensis]